MKKITKKISSKAKKTVKNLELKPDEGGKVRGGVTFDYGSVGVQYTQQNATGKTK